MTDPVNGTAIYNLDAVGNILSVTTKAASVLAVSCVSPMSSAAGSTITISGTDFGTSANTTVSIGGAAAAVSSISTNSIVATVPSGAVTGQVKVTAPGGIAYSPGNFTVTTSAAPIITGFSPVNPAPGANLTISGSGFSTTIANNKVFINERSAQITAATATSLTVVVPNLIEQSGTLQNGVGSGHVAVETAYGSAETSSYLELQPPGFTSSPLGTVTSGSFGGSASTTVSSTSQVGMILFDATAGQRAVFVVTSQNVQGDGNLRLFGPDTQQLGGVVQTGVGSTLPPQTLLLTGTYTILYDPYGVAGTVGVSLINVPPDFVSTITDNGSAVSGNTTSPYQQIHLTFSGSVGQLVSLLVTSPSPPSDCETLTVTAPDQSTQLYNSCAGPATFFTGSMTLPQAGKYTIALAPVNADELGQANFTLYSVPANVSASTTIGAAAKGLSNTVPGQGLQIQFPVTSTGQTFTFNATVLTELNGVIATIIEPDGKTQLKSQSFSGNTVALESGTLPVTGTYTAVISPQGTATGSFSLGVTSP